MALSRVEAVINFEIKIFCLKDFSIQREKLFCPLKKRKNFDFMGKVCLLIVCGSFYVLQSKNQFLRVFQLQPKREERGVIYLRMYAHACMSGWLEGMDALLLLK